jgi:hypothetical protein
MMSNLLIATSSGVINLTTKTECLSINHQTTQPDWLPYEQ